MYNFTEVTITVATVVILAIMLDTVVHFCKWYPIYSLNVLSLIRLTQQALFWILCFPSVSFWTMLLFF